MWNWSGIHLEAAHGDGRQSPAAAVGAVTVAISPGLAPDQSARLPDDAAHASVYVRLVARQLRPSTRGPPQAGGFRLPAVTVQARPYTKVNLYAQLLKAMTAWSPSKHNRSNPQPPLRTEDMRRHARRASLSWRGTFSTAVEY